MKWQEVCFAQGMIFMFMFFPGFLIAMSFVDTIDAMLTIFLCCLIVGIIGRVLVEIAENS